MSDRLFDVEPIIEVADTDSYTVKLTKRNKALLQRGIHPATGRALRAMREPFLSVSGRTFAHSDNQSCETCEHLVTRSSNRTYYKCGLVPITAGAASDIRISWPACELWEPNPS